MKLRYKLGLMLLGLTIYSWMILQDDARIRHEEAIKKLQEQMNNYLGD